MKYNLTQWVTGCYFLLFTIQLPTVLAQDCCGSWQWNGRKSQLTPTAMMAMPGVQSPAKNGPRWRQCWTLGLVSVCFLKVSSFSIRSCWLLFLNDCSSSYCLPTVIKLSPNCKNISQVKLLLNVKIAGVYVVFTPHGNKVADLSNGISNCCFSQMIHKCEYMLLVFPIWHFVSQPYFISIRWCSRWFRQTAVLPLRHSSWGSLL